MSAPELITEGTGNHWTYLCRFGYPDRISLMLHLKCCTYTTSKRTIVCSRHSHSQHTVESIDAAIVWDVKEMMGS